LYGSSNGVTGRLFHPLKPEIFSSKSGRPIANRSAVSHAVNFRKRTQDNHILSAFDQVEHGGPIGEVGTPSYDEHDRAFGLVLQENSMSECGVSVPVGLLGVHT
jgi:hypothetical protein